MAQATSIAKVIQSPKLMGVWLHAVEDAEATSSNFLYGNISRNETIEVQGTAQKFIGRTHPVYDTGGFETQVIKIDITIPSGSDEMAQVEWFRQAVRARRTLCYRDNRGRKHFVVLLSMNIGDARIGTYITFDASTVDYSEEID